MFYLSTWARISSSLITNYDYCHKNTSLYREKKSRLPIPTTWKRWFSCSLVAYSKPSQSLITSVHQLCYVWLEWRWKERKERREWRKGRERENLHSLWARYFVSSQIERKWREEERKNSVLIFYFLCEPVTIFSNTSKHLGELNLFLLFPSLPLAFPFFPLLCFLPLLN